VSCPRVVQIATLLGTALLIGACTHARPTDPVILARTVARDVYATPLAITDSALSVETEQFRLHRLPERVTVHIWQTPYEGRPSTLLLDVFVVSDENGFRGLTVSGPLAEGTPETTPTDAVARRQTMLAALLRATGWKAVLNSTRDPKDPDKEIIFIESGARGMGQQRAAYDTKRGILVSVGMPF
jgi:hypothetical protein